MSETNVVEEVSETLEDVSELTETEYQEQMLGFTDGLAKDLDELTASLDKVVDLLEEEQDSYIVISDGVSYLMESQKARDEAEAEAESEVLEVVDEGVPIEVQTLEYLDYINTGLILVLVVCAAILGAVVFRLFSARVV